jgi:peptidoglycan-associated lipoprotein
VCVQGQCVECALDENCKPGFSCQQNKCVPKSECKSAADCGAGKRCDAGKCVTGECSSDADCSGGTCRNNFCVRKGTCVGNDDCGTGEECREGLCSSAVGAGACNFDEPVRFGFNEATLSADSQQRLASLADCIKRQNLKVRLEGHADERGTEEYNLHLSTRRAASVKKYLSDLGASSSKVETVGYGENRPKSSGHDEEAWAENRRVEFKVNR